ncbi:type III PLP-dependent enzyme [Paracoccus rhizosphaerae]|uniref:Type III PLP-dependent enzyme n=1 Tax=Paracoccus rhizosphaerae TaxID=1133347 RepID=A0ABV6CK93_9RHOB|nr:type III PLP-dependent enzyme [Paracoccus rhizosphaerae]
MSDLDVRLGKVAQRYGTPTYVYLTDAIEDRLNRIRAALGPWFELSYAMKCNPNPALLEWLAGRVDLIDVSSVGELRLARQSGWDPLRASFTGPGKRLAEIAEAIDCGVGELVVENLREAQIASRLAGEAGRTQDILIRLAPATVPKGFGDHMAGRPSAFGFDIETVDQDLPAVLALPHLNVVGLHIYSGTQCLKPQAICENYRIFMSVFRDICERYDITPRKLVFGSGLGIPYHAGDTALDLDEVADGIRADLEAFRAEPRFAASRLILELGRFLVGEAGYFLTSVVAIKPSRGHTIGICDGGMNNHLPASGHFGMVIHRNYRMHRIGGGEATDKYNLVGPLCTSIDRLASAVMLPLLAEGDVIALHSSGAYGPTASPIHFISHTPPREVLMTGDTMRDVSVHRDRIPNGIGDAGA